MSERPRLDFYEIQSRQWRKSLFLFIVMILFYFLAVGIIAFSILASVGLFFREPKVFTEAFLWKFLLTVGLASVLIAIFHWYDARRFGAAYILKRLAAQSPDPADRYHKQLINTVEEIRIASGLPRVNVYVIPFFAINSLALIEADQTPSVAVTEGLLADCTRDELQAVAAHELAHISRGDAYFVTLVCSLANFFEKIREALEPEQVDEPQPGVRSRRAGPVPALLYLAVALSAIVMHLLSMLLSRQREILADGAAVEISRNPAALARVIYRAHLKNSFVGDFSLTYSPLFIVAPKLTSESDNIFSRIFNSHPPVMTRIKLLADMAGMQPAEIVGQVLEIQKNRERFRGVLHSFEEIRKGDFPTEATGVSDEQISPEASKVWLIQDPQGKWQGPLALHELVFLPHFTTLRHIKNLQEKVEAPAREFPQIRLALHKLDKIKPVDPSIENKCPRCHIPLTDTFYESVAIKVCHECRGKLVSASLMERIIVRKEVSFSADLIQKAHEFREKFLRNPVKIQKSKEKEAPSLMCPSCGYRMVVRPYNYSYFVPVDKCFSCYKIWFDADELEILQILIEKL